MGIHPSAIVSQRVSIGERVEIGPYSIIEDQVSIGSGTTIGAHSLIYSHTHIGMDNHIAAHVVLGGAPQDISFGNRPTELHIGNGNHIREYSSIHRATRIDQPTHVGDRNYIMCNSHIGHDCQIGDGVIITSFVGLGGHVIVEDHAVIGAGAGIHQFCRIGCYAMVAGFTPLRKDVLPFCMIGGQPVRHYRLNTVGLRRAGVKAERYQALEQAVRVLRRDLRAEFPTDTEETRWLRQWIDAPSKRGIYGFA